MTEQIEHPDKLPWYVSGQLEAVQRARIRAHLQVCLECSEAVRRLESLRDTMRRGWHKPPDDSHATVEDLVALESRSLELDESAGERLEKHLAGCADCREDLESLKKANERLARQTRTMSAGLGITGLGRARQLGLAAAILVAIVGFAAVLISRPPPSNRIVLPPGLRSVEQVPTLPNTGPWPITVVLPFEAPDGDYALSLAGPDSVPVEGAFTRPVEARNGRLDLTLPPLVEPGIYRLSVQPNDGSAGPGWDYSFRVAAGGPSALPRQPGSLQRSPAAEEAARDRLISAASAHSPDLPAAAARFGAMFTADEMIGQKQRKPLLECNQSLRAATPGRDEDRIAADLMKLAGILVETGDYEATFAILQGAMDASTRRGGPEDATTATVLYMMGESRRLQGDHAQARILHQRALRIEESVLGPSHPAVASSLTALSWIMRFNGDYPAGIAMASRAAAIRETAEPSERRKLPMSLSSLAGIYRDMGEFAKARPLYDRALRLWEAEQGPEGIDVAIGLTNLALLLTRSGEHQAATDSAQRALRIREKSFPDGHYMIARSLVNLAETLAGGGDDDGAAAALERALLMQEKTFGPHHFELAQTLGMLAEIRLRKGNLSSALATALRLESLARRNFQTTARVLTETQILRYESVKSSGLDVALSVADSNAGDLGKPDAQGIPSRIWDEVIRSRALVLDEIGLRHRDVFRDRSPEVLALASAVTGAQRRLAQLSVRGPDRGGLASYTAAMSAAQREAETAEQSLVEASTTFRRQAHLSDAGLAEVSRARPPDVALVAYLKYNHREPRSRSAPVPSYVALVLAPGRKDPDLIRLGTAARIEPLVETWRDSAGSDPRMTQDGAGDARLLSAGVALRTAIWDPIHALVRGARHVLVVPDGAISLVSLAALPDGNDRYLVESGPIIHYLSAERILVGDAAAPPSGENGLLALGGPDFDEPADRQSSGHEKGVMMASYRGATPACDEFRSVRFEPLPASVLEARQVQALWRTRDLETTLLTGPAADEGTFKRLAGRHRILHLATHGFMLQGDCARPPESAVDGKGPAASFENPMLLSGLALAGANQRGETGSPTDGEDGILTAEEIASLDLTGVEWAVLSGCETGLGRVLSGEGVFGLRRAFEVAGARTLIMSLWKVEDDATRSWMTALYEARLSGLSTAESMRHASLKILDAQRKRGRTTHPFFWGAFVAAGDWR